MQKHELISESQCRIKEARQERAKEHKCMIPFIQNLSKWKLISNSISDYLGQGEE